MSVEVRIWNMTQTIHWLVLTELSNWLACWLISIMISRFGRYGCFFFSMWTASVFPPVCPFVLLSCLISQTLRSQLPSRGALSLFLPVSSRLAESWPIKGLMGAKSWPKEMSASWVVMSLPFNFTWCSSVQPLQSIHSPSQNCAYVWYYRFY